MENYYPKTEKGVGIFLSSDTLRCFQFSPRGEEIKASAVMEVDFALMHTAEADNAKTFLPFHRVRDSEVKGLKSQLSRPNRKI